jgi:hypothetical protein
MFDPYLRFNTGPIMAICCAKASAFIGSANIARKCMEFEGSNDCLAGPYDDPPSICRKSA